MYKNENDFWIFILYSGTLLKSFISDSDLEKENKGGITLYTINLFYKAIGIKTAWYWHKQTHRSMEQKEEPRCKPTPLWSINI